MVRALAGDSTMTRFFGTAGSVAPGPYPTLVRSDLADAAQEVLVDLEVGLGLGLGRAARGPPQPRRRSSRAPTRVAAGHRAGRDLDEPDVEVREEEDRRRCRRRRPAACRSSCRRFVQRRPTSPGEGASNRSASSGCSLLRWRIDVADHAPIVARGAPARQPADGPVRGGRSRPPGGPARPRPRRRSRPGRRPAFIRFT